MHLRLNAPRNSHKQRSTPLYLTLNCRSYDSTLATTSNGTNSRSDPVAQRIQQHLGSRYSYPMTKVSARQEPLRPICRIGPASMQCTGTVIEQFTTHRVVNHFLGRWRFAGQKAQRQSSRIRPDGNHSSRSRAPNAVSVPFGLLPSPRSGTPWSWRQPMPLLASTRRRRRMTSGPRWSRCSREPLAAKMLSRVFGPAARFDNGVL